MCAQRTVVPKIRNVTLKDIKEVYRLLTANRPYVGLNSRYTYFLLALDFSETCIVAEYNNKIIAFSSGYIPPNRSDTFFNWEIVVHQDYRGNGLQMHMWIHQIKMSNAKFFEGTVNPSNITAKKNFLKLAKTFKTKCEEKILFSEEDFENDGHEAEVLYTVGPIDSNDLQNKLN